MQRHEGIHSRGWAKFVFTSIRECASSEDLSPLFLFSRIFPRYTIRPAPNHPDLVQATIQKNNDCLIQGSSTSDALRIRMYQLPSDDDWLVGTPNMNSDILLSNITILNSLSLRSDFWRTISILSSSHGFFGTSFYDMYGGRSSQSHALYPPRFDLYGRGTCWDAATA